MFSIISVCSKNDLVLTTTHEHSTFHVCRDQFNSNICCSKNPATSSLHHQYFFKIPATLSLHRNPLLLPNL